MTGINPTHNTIYIYLFKTAQTAHAQKFSTVLVVLTHQWPLLLTWFNFNPSMDK